MFYKVSLSLWVMVFTLLSGNTWAEDIPKGHHLTKIQVLEYFQFSRLIKGNLNANLKDYRDMRRVDLSYEQDGGRPSAIKDAAGLFQKFIAEYERMHRKIVTITLPERYAVIRVPQALNIPLPNSMGAYTFDVGQSNGTFNAVCSMTMKKTVGPSLYYVFNGVL